jgi:hypothetical protein
MKKTKFVIAALLGAGISAVGCGDDGKGGGSAGAGGAGACPEGQELCGDECVTLASNRDHCGACGQACEGGTVCEEGSCVASCSTNRTECDGGCVDVQTDPDHCGACGNECAFASADGACVAGECAFVRCQEGFSDCDGDPQNGCERDVRSDRRHCGECGNRCDIGAVCDEGECSELASPADLAGSNFSVRSLKTQCTSVDHYSATGDDRSGLAVGATRFFVTGDSMTSVMSSSDLSAIGTRAVVDVLVSDLITEKVYGLADADGNLLTGGFGSFASLVELDAAGAVSGSPIALSQAVSTATSTRNIVFSGPGFFVHYNDNTNVTTRIDFADGAVTELSTTLDIPACFNNEGWGETGIAEFHGGEEWLLYPSCNGVNRVRVSTGSSASLLTHPSIDDLHQFSFLPSQSRWYFHHEGSSILGAGDEVAGFCGAQWSSSSCGPNPNLGACAGTCLDLRFDDDNCGACGNECGAGEVCVDGVCDTCAEARLTSCGGACSDLKTDADNCGTCGNECGGDTPFCIDGKCADATPSCKNTGASSGLRTIVPGGSGAPVQVYCENTDLAGQGGGWTLLAVFANGDAQNSWTPLGTAWTQATTFGDPTDPATDADAKSAAFNRLPIEELAIVRAGGAVQVVTQACYGGSTLLELFQRSSESDADCASTCGTAFLGGNWTGQNCQTSELKLRCMDTDGVTSVDGYAVAEDDNSFITTLDNGSCSHSNFGLGAGESGDYADWDSNTDDQANLSDVTPILLFGR